MPEPATEQPDPAADATPPPLALTIALWIPVVAVIAWGMMLLVGQRPWEFPGTPRDDEPPPDE